MCRLKIAGYLMALVVFSFSGSTVFSADDENPKPARTKKPVVEPGEKPAAEPGDKPADDPGDKPADEKPKTTKTKKPADEPGDKPADEKPKTSKAKKPADEPGDKPAKKPSGEKPTRAAGKGAITKVATVDVGGKAQDIRLVGDRAYVATSAGLTILDISNLTSPKKLGTASHPGTNQGVAVKGKHAFLANMNDGFVVVDISNEAAPKVVTSKPVAKCWSVAVKDDGAYAIGLGGNFHVFDISSPASAKEVLKFSLPSWRASDYRHKPASPQQEKANLQALKNNSGGGGNYKTGVSVTGDKLVAVDWVYGRIFLYDVSTPTKPVFKGTHFAPYMLQAHIHGDWIYGFAAYNTLSGVYSVKLSDLSPDKPTGYHKCTTCGVIKSNGSIDMGGMGVSESGKHVFFYGGKTGLFQVIDVSNPSQMKAVASDQISGHGVKMPQIMGCMSRGDHIFVTAGAKGVVVYRFAGL